MDPTAAVNRMRELTSAIQEQCLKSDYSTESLELAECFSALDSWLSKNGALPEQWKYKDK